MSTLELPPQDDSQAASRNIRLLAVPQPSTDGQGHLAGVRGEIEIIRNLTSSSPFVGFQEADGTVKDVLSKMTETDWVHFACHGTQDRTNPLDSGFLLAHGNRLKLLDIARVSRPLGGLAFLSACHTATGDEGLSEEAIHIAAGMLLAGYRGTIATMWTIMDNDAPRVTEDVYKSLLGDGKVPDSRQAAEALHHAVERLRDSGASFLSWVPFIHVGL
jgi:CHAT domain-containing protein